LSKLGDRLHLNREQAYNALGNQILPIICGGEPELQGYARQIMIDMLKIMYNSSRWEDRFGAMQGSILLIEKFYDVQAEAGVDSALKDFVWNTIRAEKLMMLMVDDEFRVRN